MALADDPTGEVFKVPEGDADAEERRRVDPLSRRPFITISGVTIGEIDAEVVVLGPADEDRNKRGVETFEKIEN